MSISPEKIAPSVALVIIGVVIFIIGATGTVPLINPPLVIPEPYKTILVILGVVLILAGLILGWAERPSASDEHGASTSFFSRKSKGQQGITICSADEANIEYLSKFIDTNSIAKARMIQYSGDMIRPVIAKLLAKNVKIEILLQHPQKALNIDQLLKMASFHERVTTDFKNPQNLVIKYYNEPASIRGVKLDEKVLVIGWYTYRVKSHTEPKAWLYGHNNAAVRIQPVSVSRDLTATFDDVFQSLWDNSVSNINVAQEIENARKKFTSSKPSSH